MRIIKIPKKRSGWGRERQPATQPSRRNGNGNISQKFTNAIHDNGQNLKTARNYIKFSCAQIKIPKGQRTAERLRKIIDIMERGVRGHSQNPALLHQMGLWYNRANKVWPENGYTKKAVQAFWASHTLAPANVENLDRLGAGLTRCGRYDEAEQAFALIAMREDKITGWTYIRLGNLYAKQPDKTELAIICYSAAVDSGNIREQQRRGSQQTLPSS